MPSKYISKTYVDACTARMSKDLSDEIARTISEIQDGFEEIVQPIMERVTRLSTEESRTAAAVVKVSEDGSRCGYR